MAPLKDEFSAEISIDLPGIYLSLNEFQIDLFVSLIGGNLSEHEYLLSQPSLESLEDKEKITKLLEENIPANIKLNVEEIVFSIKLGGGEVKSSEILNFTSKKMCISMISFPDESMELSLALKSIALTDTASTENKYPNLIESIHQSKDENILQLNLSINQNNDTFVEVYIGTIVAQLAPQGIWNLVLFSAPHLSKLPPVANTASTLTQKITGVKKKKLFFVF